MFKETCNLYPLPSLYNESDPNKISLTSHVLSLFYKIMKFLISPIILDFTYILFLKAYYIKKQDPVINHGLKALKELLLFN